jgi:hypothetical protein
MNLKIELHPNKSKIFPLYKGVDFLGFKIFYYYKRARKRNVNNFKRRLEKLEKAYLVGDISKSKFIASVEGWFAYVMWGNTYNLRLNFAKEVKKILDSNKKETQQKLF